MPEGMWKWIIASSGVIYFWMSLFLPVWEGFDEPAHFCYIQHLVEHKEIPMPPGRGDTDYCSTEVEATLSSLPLNQTIGNSPQLGKYGYPGYDEYWKNKNDEKPVIISNDKTDRLTTHTILDIWQGQHPPLPYIILAIPYLLTYFADFFVRFFALRLVSVAIVLVGLFAMWKSMGIAIKDTWTRLFGFAFLCFSPMFIFHFARISNEPLTFLLFSALWYLILRLLTEEKSPRSIFVMLGLVCGLGILSKVFFLASLPALFLVLLMDFVRRWKDKKERKTRLLGYVIIFASIAIPAIPWTIYQKLGFVNPGLGFEGQTSTTFTTLLSQIQAVPWLIYFKEIFLNFVGLFGWSFIRGPLWFYILYGLFWYFTISGISKTRGIEKQIAFSALLFPLAILAGMSFYNLRFEYLAISGGWYLYSVSAMLGTLIALVWQARIPERFRPHAVFGVIIFHLLSFIWITFHYLIPSYYAI